jgi:beta-lactamase regulating signal transducer with metallopeptidase domain
MFLARGIAVSFSIFVIFYGGLSVAVWCLWRRVWRFGQRHSAERCADLLFALRLLPFAIASVVTLAFAVPSFLLLEPRSVDEPIGAVPLALAGCGMGLMAVGMWKALAALAQASRNIARWSRAATRMSSGIIDSMGDDSRRGNSTDADFRSPVFLLRASAAAPPLTAAGILRPSVWLSEAAEFVLTRRELQCALRHERVHLWRRDNLRKLMLRLVAFLGMAELESAWREATEMAADDAAVANAAEALDLAAAVIKLSRLVPLQPAAELTTALVHTPAESVNARVERLIAWEERRQRPRQEGSRQQWWSRYALGAGFGVIGIAVLALTYGELLLQVHAATEWLVR